jgi:hypothetical protein
MIWRPVLLDSTAPGALGGLLGSAGVTRLYIDLVEVAKSVTRVIDGPHSRVRATKNRNLDLAVSRLALDAPGYGYGLISEYSGFHRRARWPPRLRMGASGSGGLSDRGCGADAGSSFASADFSGASRGDSGNLSSAIERRTARVTAACSSSVSSTVGI